MPKKKLKKTPQKTITPGTTKASVPEEAPFERMADVMAGPTAEIGTCYEGQTDLIPDFEGEPGCPPDPKVAPSLEPDDMECPDPPYVRDLLPSFGEGPRRLEPHPVNPQDKNSREQARNEQETFWIGSVIAQNSKKPHGLLWLEAQREYQNRRIGPVQNWPLKISTLVEQKFRSLIEDQNFLRPLVRFHIRINNTPQVMPMTLYATYAATVEALRVVLEDNFEEI